MWSYQTCIVSCTISWAQKEKIIRLCTVRATSHLAKPFSFLLPRVSFLCTLTMLWCWIISLAFQESLFSGVLSLNRVFFFFFFFPCSLAEENGEKDCVCWGVQKWYREIDEAVRAGVITWCPFPKPDWQTANITQTPGPDRHPNLQPRPNGVWASKFSPCGIIPVGTGLLCIDKRNCCLECVLGWEKLRGIVHL